MNSVSAIKNAVMLVKEHIRNSALDNATLAQEIAKHAVPIRPGRKDHRNLKIKGFVGFTFVETAAVLCYNNFKTNVPTGKKVPPC